MNIILTKPLINAINEVGLTNSQRRKAIKLIQIILFNPEVRNELLEYKYKDLSQNYMRKVFNSRYYEWFNKLRDAGIIEAFIKEENETYYAGQSKTYRVNPNLLAGEMIEENIEPSLFVSTFLTNTVKASDIIDDFNSLIIDEQKLIDIKNDYIQSLTLSSLKINDAINAPSVEVYNPNTREFYWISKQKAIEQAQKKGKTLIQGNQKCYVMNTDEYLIMKRNHVEFSYNHMIKSLINKSYFIHRNDTNNRLDSNYTNLSARLLEVIKADNNLVELDVYNCQFALICRLYRMMGEPLTANFRFYEFYAIRGHLYEFIKMKMNLSSRKEAKSLMFEMCFSSKNFHSSGKRALHILFPDVMDFINSFKTKKGDREFPISLQRLESELFIDIAYERLKSDGYFCISRHDSLLVREEDAESIYHILSSLFSEANFNCTINCEWDEEKWMLESYTLGINNFYPAA